MKILAKHPKKGRMTFEKNLFNQILLLEPEWEIINSDYNGSFSQTINIKKITVDRDISKIIGEPEIINIEEKIEDVHVKVKAKTELDIARYTVTKFRNDIEIFTIDELNLFVKGSGISIQKLAKARIKKLSL